MRRRWFVLGASGLVLPACLSTLTYQAKSIRAQAAQEFSCSADQVQAETLDELVDCRMFKVTGCGREAIYACPYGGVPGSSPTERASFDLSCPAVQLKMTYLANHSVGVDGCGKKVSYTWVRRAWVGSPAQ